MRGSSAGRGHYRVVFPLASTAHRCGAACGCVPASVSVAAHGVAMTRTSTYGEDNDRTALLGEYTHAGATDGRLGETTMSDEDRSLQDKFAQTDLYASAVTGPVLQVASTVATVPELISAALLPLRALTATSGGQYQEWLSAQLAETMSDVELEEIVFPNPHIAGPAYQAVKYTAREPVIRDMLVQLLASTLNEQQASVAHPSFVGCIQLMDEADARVLQVLAERRSAAYVELRAEADSGRGQRRRRVSLLGVHAGLEDAGRALRSVDSLERLGLCCLDRDGSGQSDDDYSEIENHQLFADAKQDLESEGDAAPDQERGSVALTEFGDAFVQCCFKS
jgi:hypothetical protein